MNKTISIAVVLVACGCGAPSPAGTVPRGGEEPGAAPGAAPSRDLRGAKVFDATGRALACEPPKPDCPEVSTDRDFLDRCKLSGFQVRQCGCAMRCAGDVSAKGPRYYDAQGEQHACTEEHADCTPTQPTAAFQDACNEKGHKLVACNCVWFCSGKPATP
jgi:hypothetical protein